MRWVETGRGLRLLNGRHTITEVLTRPGPTHSVFDVLGACAALLSTGGPMAVLGFAGGGLMAPLRALGCDVAVSGVDLSLDGARAFKRVSRHWAGAYQVVESDAADFLLRSKRPFDLIIEDLSLQIPGDVIKPMVSLEVLPGRIAASLAPGGTAIVNVLPVSGMRLREVVSRLAKPLARAGCELSFDAFDNRILVLGRRVPPPATFGRALRAALRTLRSRQANQIHVRRWREVCSKNRG